MEFSFFNSVSTDRILSVSLSFRVWIPEKLTSMFFDKFTKISDEEGYLAGLIIWLFLIFIIEFLIPFIKSKN